jgi:bacillolysin
MFARKFVRMLMLVTMSVSTIVSLLGTAAVAEPGQPSVRAVAQLQARAATALSASYDARYGNITFFMGAMPYEPSAAVRGNPFATAVEFLAQNKDLYQMQDPSRELSLVRTTSDALGQVHVRLAQQHNGVPVFGRSLYVHLDARGNVIGTNGHYVPGIAVESTAALSSGAASNLAVKAAGTAGATVQGQPQLVVYIDDAGVAHLTWLVDVVDMTVPSRTTYFMAARGGEVVHAIDLLETAKNREIYDAGNQENIPGDLVGREGEVPREKSAKAAYQFSGAVYDYYASTHNRDSVDDQGLTLVSTVHFGENYGNAFWDGQQMVYGDGDESVTQPYVFALDVDAHEMTHGVTQYTAALIYEGQSGALNESFSDVMAVAVERKNWQMGEDIWNPATWPTPYLRDFIDPSLGGNYDPENPLESFGQPSKMSEYANLPSDRRSDNGGVHINSGISNHAAYLFAKAMDGNDGLSDQGLNPMAAIWYRTLTTYLTDSATFQDFGNGVLQAAKDLSSDYPGAEDALTSALEETEILGPDGQQPTPPPSPTPRGGKGTPVPQPTPNKTAGCTELVQNAGFENNKPDPWVEYTALDVPIIGNELPHTGKKSAWMGGSDEEAFQYIYQDLKIPANAKSVTLSYWHYLHEEFNQDDGSKEPATFSALLANTDGDILADLEDFTSDKADDAWGQSALELKKYAGKTVRLAFVANMVTNNISSFFVDDVSLLACTTGAPPTPPPNGGSEGVTVSGHITDYNTGDGISGATVYILNPGTSATDAADDNRVTEDEVYSSGVTDRDGLYSLDKPLERGQTYSAIVIAQGYYSIIADDVLQVDDSWPDVVEDVDGEMQPAQ